MQALALWLGSILLAATATAPAAVPDSPAALLAAINDERAAAALAPLAEAPILEEAAAWRAREIERRGELPGSTRDIVRMSRRLFAAGYEAHRWTESAAAGGGDLLAGWRRQRPEAYREAVLGDYSEIGIALARLEGQPLAVFLLALPKATEEMRRAASLGDLETVRRAVLDQVNALRSERGLGALEPAAALDRAAQAHAENMLAGGFYDHHDPAGDGPGERVRREDRGYRRIGENIARGLFTPEEVVERWMNSRGHRRNILSSGFRELGVGVAYGVGPDGVAVYWVQVFGG